MKGEKAVVEADDVAGMEPAVMQRLRRRVGLVPVSRHYGLSARQHFTRFSGRQRRPLSRDRPVNHT
jgi:hypothetical protein